MAPMTRRAWCSPGQLVLLAVAGWLNREQQQVVEHQKEEIRVLREMLGGKRLRFTDAQRGRRGRFRTETTTGFPTWLIGVRTRPKTTTDARTGMAAPTGVG